MDASELFAIGEKFYHDGQKVHEAISALEHLINLYPDHIKGLQYLATMYYENAEFDKWLSTIDKAIELDPNNITIKEHKNTRLSLMARFTFEDPYFYDESTKECHSIDSFNDQIDIKKALFNSISELISLNPNKDNNIYNYTIKLGHLSMDFKAFEEAINYYQKASKSIPERFNEDRKARTLQSIEKFIAVAYLENKDFKKSLMHLEKAFQLGLDDYSKMLEADIYEAMGTIEKAREVLYSLVETIEEKLKSKPEQAYISQQIQVLLRLNAPERAKVSLKYFDVLPDNDFHRTRKKEFTDQIERHP